MRNSETVYNPSSVMNVVQYQIDGIVLEHEDVLFQEVYWSKDTFACSTRIALKNNSDAQNLFPLNSENIFTLYSEDRFGDYFFKKFQFVGIQDTKLNKRVKVQYYQGVDRLSYAMQNTYMSKSYAGVFLSDIIGEYFEAYGWEALIDEGCVLELLPTEKFHEYIVVPQHVSFLEFIKGELHKEGYTMYQTKKSVRIGVKVQDVAPSKLEMIDWDKYAETHTLTEHPFRIHETVHDYNPDLTQNSEAPKQIATTFTFGTKMSTPFMQTIEDFGTVYADYTMSSGGLQNIQKTVGAKLEMITDNATSKVKTRMQDALHKTSSLQILIVGNIMYNDIYKNCTVELAGSMEHNQGQAEGDVRHEGKYTIVQVTDRFLSGKMIQKLHLQRADFTAI